MALPPTERRPRLAAARLYLVCDGRPRRSDPEPLLRAAIDGGVDILQLRDPGMADAELIAAAEPFRRLAAEASIPFIVNDRPDLVGPCGADGVHVGQDDLDVAEARRIVGDEGIVGLSTHSIAQVKAASEAAAEARPDAISVGPVWETPTKPGRAATGLGLIRAAADAADATSLPWFAIGGIDPTNVADLIAAGARRIVVVRAIRDAGDPEAATRELRAALDGVGVGSG